MWPVWFRLAVIAVATSILSACRIAAPNGAPSLDGGPPAAVPTAVPAAIAAAAPWRPPGIAGPWPRDEYLHDGGDGGLPAAVAADWTVHGVEQQDTIAHFDTLDGRTLIQPSNRVHLYAPRFAAVRRVQNPAATAMGDGVSVARADIAAERYDDQRSSNTTLQRVGPAGRLAVRAGSLVRRRQQGGALDGPQRMAAAEASVFSQHDTSVQQPFRSDVVDQVRLTEVIDIVQIATHVHQVQVILDGRAAAAAVKDQRAEVVYEVDQPNHPRLQLVKTASTRSARPGEQVDFTIRYLNVGDQTVGNVVLIDHLQTRLQLIEGTDQSSAPATFKFELDDSGSYILRWEISAPVRPGTGGVVRFRCRVR